MKVRWLLAFSLLASTIVTFSPNAGANSIRVQEYAKQQLRFEQNVGQSDSQALFVARADGYTVFLTASGFVLRASGKRGTSPANDAVVDIRFVGVSPATHVSGVDKFESYSNYFIGRDPRQWHSRVPNYARVSYRHLYPGLDLVYYGNQGQLENDIVVSRGGNPDLVRLRINAQTEARIDAAGDVVLPFADASFTLHKPTVYQVDASGRRNQVKASYVWVAKNELGFRLGSYNKKYPLTIDPVVTYSTYLGGSSDDFATAITVDDSGHAYVAGSTFSTDFPLAHAYQNDNRGPSNAFVTKFSADGKSVLYSTYLGGSGESGQCQGDNATSIAISPTGRVYVAGVTQSADFPVTQNAYQKLGGGCTGGGGGHSGFFTAFSLDGSSLAYSSYLGGSFIVETWIMAITLDAHGAAYLGGYDNGGQLATPGAFQTGIAGEYAAFIAKFSSDGARLLHCTYYGGTEEQFQGATVADGIAVDRHGHAWIFGGTNSPSLPVTSDAFQATFGGANDVVVAGFDPTLSGLLYATFLGGTGNDYVRGAFSSAGTLAMDASGDLYVTGVTDSRDFPTSANAFQTTYPGGTTSAFVTKFVRNRPHTVYSTYLGGSRGASGAGVGVSKSCSNSCPVFAYGATNSVDFPVLHSLQDSGDLFVSVLDPTLARLVGYSTYFGAATGDTPAAIAVDADLSAFFTGNTPSNSFPTTPGSFQPNFKGGHIYGDAFVTRIAPK